MSLIEAIGDILKIKTNIVLNVVGDGDMREGYENYVSNMGLSDSIKFWGKLDGEKLVEKYQESHIFVSASTNESFSMVILEAMASALPVIAFNVGSTSQMIEDNINGFLLSYSNVEGLKNKIVELIDYKDKAKMFGDENRKKVEGNYTWYKKYEEYRNVIGKYIN